MKKKLLAMLLAVMMTVGLLPGTAWAFSGSSTGGSGSTHVYDSTACGENLTWSYSDGVLTINGTGDIWGFVVDDYNGDERPWRDYSKEIHTVVIGDGVTSIGLSAFSGFESLTSVTIPNGVTTIEGWAFWACDSLTDVYYGGSESQWNGISVGDGNELLLNAEIHYASAPGETEDPGETEEPGETENPGETETPDITFTDVNEGDWFYDDVQWAVKNDWIQGNGDGTFTPKDVCNEEMILTLLYNAKGKPSSTTVAPVTVKPWYQDAVNWAYEQEIIDDTFQPNTPGTRARAIYLLWKVYSSESSEGEIPFTDIPEDADYIDALAWAVKEGIVEGNGDGTFDPDGDFLRAHIVRFLRRTVDPSARVNAND